MCFVGIFFSVKIIALFFSHSFFSKIYNCLLYLTGERSLIHLAWSCPRSCRRLTTCFALRLGVIPRISYVSNIHLKRSACDMLPL
ncbi:Germin-like protein subfamily T member 2 [Frankliniella fusca]|uniref:Germin-like protein subfamily T member 2 n=1 Tax=Frankliniella fusca TaxID=407009 RepID=A0AAE1I0J4_9NEOP|nr:Germin-like protein subfamily T member 2 [Frankliniella fusca]